MYLHYYSSSNLTLPVFPVSPLLFFFNDTPTTEIYTLSLHDALPISNQPKPTHHNKTPFRLLWSWPALNRAACHTLTPACSSQLICSLPTCKQNCTSSASTVTMPPLSACNSVPVMAHRSAPAAFSPCSS